MGAIAQAAGYMWGQCTWFVGQALPWLGFGQVGNLGNAADWFSNARAKGIPVSSTPQVGAAVVYSSAFPGSHGAGHVGVVTALNPNGTFQVASDNWGAPGVTHVGTLTSPDVVGFILPPSSSAGVQGARNALAMAAGGAPGSSVNVPVGSYGTGQGQDPNSHFSLSNWNPFDPSSFLNVPGDVAGLSQVPGNVASGVGGVGGTVIGAVINWIERLGIIIFALAIVLAGIFILFGKGGNATQVIGAPPDAGSPDVQAVTGTETRVVRGPRGGVRGSSTVTRTSTVKGRAPSKGSGIRRLASKGGKTAKAAKVAEVAE